MLIREDAKGSRGIKRVLLTSAACLVLGLVASVGAAPPGVSGSAYTMAVAAATLGWYAVVLVPPLFVVASAVCTGAMLKRALADRGVALPGGVAPALGLGVLLTVVHGMWWLAGFFGGLQGLTATVLAWGLAMAPVIVWQRRFRLPGWLLAGGILAAGMPGTSPAEVALAKAQVRGGVIVLLVIVAGLGFVLPYAMVPPGTLWPSEYGGYDALSYHLPLAQEWYTRGWLAPVSHNVYSFLPSYFESAFVHMAALTWAPQGAPAGADALRHIGVGLLAGDGRLLLSAQALHTLTLGLAAWSVAGLVRVIGARLAGGGTDLAGGAITVASVVAAILTITAPWMVVTGTLAYNEAPLVALLAAALACALSTGLGPRGRGVLCGVLTGLACCIKPSALVLGAPMVGIAMLAGCWDAVRAGHYTYFRYVVTRRLAACVGLCLLAGAITLAPWLVRNAVAAGNPVFPFAAGALGQGHWSTEQAARYAAAHRPDRGVIDAMALMVAADVQAAPMAPAVQRHRGATNPQWMPLMPLGAAALVGLVALTRTRRTGVVLGVGVLATWIAWGALTHAQSRFLVVLVPVAATSVGCVVGVVMTRARTESSRRAVAVAAIGGLVAITGLVWFTSGPAAQASGGVGLGRGSAMEATLYGGPRIHTALEVAQQLDAAAGDGARVRAIFESASPSSYVALLPDVEMTRVLLVGGATPLYAGPVAYATAWDTWPILTQMDRDAARPSQWTRGLGEAYDYAIVDMSEVTRLWQSGYLDPRLTPDRIGEWMRTTRLVRAWSDRGIFLVDLRGGGRNGAGQ